MVDIFQARQFPLILSSIIAIGGSLKHGWSMPIQMLNDAKRSIQSARESHFLPELYFESLWEEDLSSLRKELNLMPIGTLYPPTKRLSTVVKVPV